MTTAPHPVSERGWETLRTDEELALKQAATQLAKDFSGLFGTEASNASWPAPSTSSATGPK